MLNRWSQHLGPPADDARSVNHTQPAQRIREERAPPHARRCDRVPTDGINNDRVASGVLMRVTSEMFSHPCWVSPRHVSRYPRGRDPTLLGAALRLRYGCLRRYDFLAEG